MNAHLESWQINGAFSTDHYALKLVHHVISWKEHVVLRNFGHEKDGCNFDHWPVYWRVVLNMGIPCMIIFKVILRTVLDKFHDNIVKYRYASKNHTLHKFNFINCNQTYQRYIFNLTSSMCADSVVVWGSITLNISERTPEISLTRVELRKIILDICEMWIKKYTHTQTHLMFSLCFWTCYWQREMLVFYVCGLFNFYTDILNASMTCLTAWTGGSF
jgi:hypothetical protein